MYLVKKKEISLSSHNKGLWKKKLDKKPVKIVLPRLVPLRTFREKKHTASQAENEENEGKFLRSSFGPESVVHSFHNCKSKSCSSVSSP